MIVRAITEELVASAAQFPVITILGPRQSGKTTLVQMAFPDTPYFCLEFPDVRMAAEADPRGFLKQADHGAILDEIQRVPSLLSYIQGMVDASEKQGQFILTGSHQPRLHQAISQSLAGRTALLSLWPFSISELRHYKSDWEAFELIVKGCFPRLHQQRIEPRRFYNAYLQTYVERDVHTLIHLRDLSTFQKFLVLLAGRVGQVVNFSSLSNDVGVSAMTIRNWISVLKASYVVFELPPYFADIGKRLIKSPKIYFTDVGLAAFLLGIHTEEQAARDPLRGGLYENLVITEILKQAQCRGLPQDFYFYRDAHGNEVDFLLKVQGKLIPVEIKSAETFTPDYLKGLEHFNKLGLPNASPGLVLYNGSQKYNIRGISIFNPLHITDIWNALTSIENHG